MHLSIGVDIINAIYIYEMHLSSTPVFCIQMPMNMQLPGASLNLEIDATDKIQCANSKRTNLASITSSNLC
jgi:hypothetical protein